VSRDEREYGSRTSKTRRGVRSSESRDSARIRQSLGDIVVKDIKGTSLLRPRLLKLKVSNGNLLRVEKLTLT